jgi:N-methylhydantoinase A/oxoprolinase/acetone carboxylase beta subunit
MSEYRISVDTGGTFTDIVVTDSAASFTSVRRRRRWNGPSAVSLPLLT